MGIPALEMYDFARTLYMNSESASTFLVNEIKNSRQKMLSRSIFPADAFAIMHLK